MTKKSINSAHKEILFLQVIGIIPTGLCDIKQKENVHICRGKKSLLKSGPNIMFAFTESYFEMYIHNPTDVCHIHFECLFLLV